MIVVCALVKFLGLTAFYSTLHRGCSIAEWSKVLQTVCVLSVSPLFTALIIEWPKAFPLTDPCFSSLLGFESKTQHVRKLSVTQRISRKFLPSTSVSSIYGKISCWENTIGIMREAKRISSRFSTF